MTKLIPCFDCGQLISAEAFHCPKCSSDYPRGVYCRVCNPSSRALLSEVQRFPVREGLTKALRFELIGYHEACVRRVLMVPDDSACPDCGMPIAKLWNWQALFVSEHLDGPCPECGRPSVLTNWFQSGRLTNWSLSGEGVTLQENCGGCDLPMLSWHKLVSADRRHDSTDRSLYHDFCLALVRSLTERHNRNIENKTREAKVMREKSRQGGCFSSLLVGVLIAVLLNFSAILIRYALDKTAAPLSGDLAP